MTSELIQAVEGLKIHAKGISTATSYKNAIDDVIALIRQYKASKPDVEAVARAIKSIPIQVKYRGGRLTVYHNEETALEAAKAAIQAIKGVGAL